MQQPEAFLPTAPHPQHDAGALRSRPPPRNRGTLIAMVAAALLVGLAIGIAIGRALDDAHPPPVAASSDVGHLAVSSTPTDGNVTVDGRFVGVSPIERLDVDPGKHSIVIDVFGYQPYAGTLSIEPRGKLNFKVTLAPIGSTATTTGTVTGAGTATHAIIPPSALAPATDARAAGAPPRDTAQGAHRSPDVASPPPPAAPPRPHRDCSGDQSRCTEGCRSAETSCRFACPGCSSCLTSVGWDECHRQCDTCRSSCEQNTKFCETSCTTQYDSCQASQ